MNTDLFSRLQYEPAILFIGDEIEEFDREVINYTWSMVATTSVTSDVAISFLGDKRVVTECVSEEEMKANMLDSKNLHIVRLLGKNIDTFALDDEQLDTLQDNGTRMLQKIVEIIRKAGIIIFEHFDHDILTRKEINRAFRKLIPNQYQLYIFNADEKVRSKYNNLEKDGIAIFFDESINDYFEEHGVGNIPGGAIGSKDNIQLYIEAQNTGILTTIDRREIIETENFATLLNISLLESVKVRPNMYEDYFYSFLRNSVKEPQWYGYRYEFNIHRQFEEQLYKMTIEGLTHIGDARSKPLLLMGQTGSGKSIALAALAYKIFEEKKYPVVFINDSDINFSGNNKKAFRALDLLLQRLEELGASGVLLIWDSSCFSINKKKVSMLHSNLKGRGRKVYLVASAYNDKVDNNTNESLSVENDILLKQFKECTASIEIQDEKEQLRKILVEKCGFNNTDINSILSYENDQYNFLTLFYQVFYTLRRSLALGVKKEAEFNVDQIDKELAKDVKRQE